MTASRLTADRRLEVPNRGFVSSAPAATWEEGLLSGNGTLGANVLSRPRDETIIFTHERLFLPQGAPVMPPESGPRLFEIRRLIDRGLYRQADELVCHFSTQDGFLYPDAFVPAFDLRLQTEGEKDVVGYRRSVDFETGEATVHWADSRGVYEHWSSATRTTSWSSWPSSRSTTRTCPEPTK